MAGKSDTSKSTDTEQAPAEATDPALVTTADDVLPGDSRDTIDGTERAGTLVEAADPVEPGELDGTEVVLLHHWTTSDGEAVAPGSTIRVDTEVADQLLASGYAHSGGATVSESQGTEPGE